MTSKRDLPCGLKTLNEHFILTGRDLSSIPNVQNHNEVKYLNLSNNKLDSLTGISKFGNLKELHLEYNDISSCKGIEELSKLTTLYLHDNKIADINPLLNLGKLERLNLENNKITSIEGIGALENLQELIINNNEISSIPDDIKELGLLKKVSFKGNNINSFNVLSSFSLYSNLEEVNITNNPLKINSDNFKAFITLQHRKKCSLIVDNSKKAKWKGIDPLLGLLSTIGCEEYYEKFFKEKIAYDHLQYLYDPKKALRKVIPYSIHRNRFIHTYKKKFEREKNDVLLMEDSNKLCQIKKKKKKKSKKNVCGIGFGKSVKKSFGNCNYNYKKKERRKVKMHFKSEKKRRKERKKLNRRENIVNQSANLEEIGKIFRREKFLIENSPQSSARNTRAKSLTELKFGKLNLTKSAPKYALVIGNQHYTNLTQLRYAINDANSVAIMLKEHGFIVKKYLNLDSEDMREKYDSFVMDVAEEKKDGVICFIFFAGHGVCPKIDSELLLPVDFDRAWLETRNEVEEVKKVGLNVVSDHGEKVKKLKKRYPFIRKSTDSKLRTVQCELNQRCLTKETIQREIKDLRGKGALVTDCCREPVRIKCYSRPVSTVDERRKNKVIKNNVNKTRGLKGNGKCHTQKHVLRTEYGLICFNATHAGGRAFEIDNLQNSPFTHSLYRVLRKKNKPERRVCLIEKFKLVCSLVSQITHGNQNPKMETGSVDIFWPPK